eukprot:12895252-Alexandrium_andersonii.AAC.1
MARACDGGARGGLGILGADDELVLAAREQARIASLGGSFAAACSRSSGGWQDQRLQAQNRVIAE